MKVLVLSNMAPFVWGGAEELATHLVRNLRLAGNEAELFRIPFSWEPAERLIEEIVLCRSLRLANVDRVIALKFPTYHVSWDNKVIWLLHQYRQAYDLFDAEQSKIPDNDRRDEIRRLIRESDNATFASARHIYTISRVTADRLQHYNGFSSDVLIPPVNDPELFAEGDYGDYILASGRVNAAKRQWLLVDAMRHLPRGAKLLIAGPPDDAMDAKFLREKVEAADLGDRIQLRLEFLQRGELAELVRNARAVAYLPFDEDSASYVTMEAFQAGKAVITTSDSGGLLDFVVSGETGVVAQPNAEALAAAMSSLFDGNHEAIRLGRQARARLLSQNLNWRSTIERLLS